MVNIIIKKSARELRERAAEQAPKWARGKVDAYARDVEEADRYQRETGRDDPSRKGVLMDDGGRAEKEVRDRTLRAAGLNPEHYE